MTVHAPKDRLSELDARLDRLKEENSRKGGAVVGGTTSGYGMAFTIATDLVGGVIGGALVGWLLDRWLGSAPWGMIALFFLGAAAGMWNVYRTVRGYDGALGFHQAEPPPEVRGNETETPTSVRSEKEGGDRGGQSTPSVRNQVDHPDSDRRD